MSSSRIPCDQPGGRVMAGVRTAAVSVESWGLSRRGHARAENQDAFLNWPERLLWVVADGLGGSRRGGEASRFIVRHLMRSLDPRSLDEHIASVASLLKEANGVLRRGAFGGGASTIAVLLIHHGRAACLWSGDCRCYLLRGGVLYQCTRDHTLRQRAVERKEMTPHEALRMVRGNVVTSAVGVEDVLRLDTNRFTLCRGDRFLLCSDGLSNRVSPAALCAHLGRSGARDAALGIVDDLDECGHPDDATLVTVFLTGG